MKRILRGLRSPRLPVVLFVGIGAYAVVMTFVPQGAPDSPQVLAFSRDHSLIAGLTGLLGLHKAYSHPAFVLASTLLMVSTIACSLDRTRTAASTAARWRSARPDFLGRLTGVRGLRVELRSSAPAYEALSAVATALRNHRFRSVEVGGHGVWASQNRWGVIGSPLLHWGLVALFAFAGLGQLTRWEGTLGMLVGHTVPDEPARYSAYRSGPLSTHESGRTLTVVAFDANYVRDGIERGPAPIVVMSDEHDVLANHRAHPNSPLRYGSMSVHQSQHAVGSLLTVLGPDEETIESASVPFDYEQISDDGKLSASIEVAGLPDEVYLANVRIALDGQDGRYFRRVPDEPYVEVAFLEGSQATDGGVLRAREGERIALPNGSGWLLVEDITDYVVLFVVDDWTVPFVYAALVAVCVGAAIAVLAPPRGVFVRIDTDGDQLAHLVLVAQHRRVDPGFPARLLELVDHAVNRKEG